MIKILKRLSRIVRIVLMINWYWFFKLKSRGSEILIWIPWRSVRYFGGDALIWDMATIAGLIKERKNFDVVYDKSIGKKHNKKIFFSLSNRYNLYGFDDYTHVLMHITRQLEAQGNRVFPGQAETALWENKVYMHQVFKIAGVNEPKTRIFNSLEQVLKSKIGFPFLIKAEHSCASEGLYKITCEADMLSLMHNRKFEGAHTGIIIQELINMRRDLRVILVRDEIVLHYWRINMAKEWKPTSTSYGSQVDFDFFPEQWRQHIIDTFKSLNITTGAFDITWQNDDLNTPPLYLEVSPFYQPNPRIETNGKSYAFYKNRFSVLKSWDTRYVNTVFKIKHQQIKAYLR